MNRLAFSWIVLNSHNNGRVLYAKRGAGSELCRFSAGSVWNLRSYTYFSQVTSGVIFLKNPRAKFRKWVIHDFRFVFIAFSLEIEKFFITAWLSDRKLFTVRYFDRKQRSWASTLGREREMRRVVNAEYIPGFTPSRTAKEIFKSVRKRGCYDYFFVNQSRS